MALEMPLPWLMLLTLINTWELLRSDWGLEFAEFLVLSDFKLDWFSGFKLDWLFDQFNLSIAKGTNSKISLRVNSATFQ